MKTKQHQWTAKKLWKELASETPAGTPSLLLAFGERDLLASSDMIAQIRGMYPSGDLLLASTAGEIIGSDVSDGTISLTAVWFEKTAHAVAEVEISGPGESLAQGKKLAEALPDHAGLRHVFVLSDGLKVNGTDLVAGIAGGLPKGVSITGGLAGDGSSFQQTAVGFNKPATDGKIIALGLYGKDLKIGYGSVGGWDSFGTDRLITKSVANVLYELDGKPALELYKSYLGESADGLPATGLLFPLSIKIESEGSIKEVVRTILAVNEDDQSMTFAGDIPQGKTARLMKANFERLVEGASEAAETSKNGIGSFVPELALLVSCVGRKLVLGQMVEDEVEGVREVIGEDVPVAGFYSYGELAPGNTSDQCLLHNQTMTITLLAEN